MPRQPMTVQQYARLKAIEANATTPLQPDTSDDVMFTWHDLVTTQPESDQIVLVHIASGDYTVGYYNARMQNWYTDLGPYPSKLVTHWAKIPTVKD